MKRIRDGAGTRQARDVARDTRRKWPAPGLLSLRDARGVCSGGGAGEPRDVVQMVSAESGRYGGCVAGALRLLVGKCVFKNRRAGGVAVCVDI